MMLKKIPINFAADGVLLCAVSLLVCRVILIEMSRLQISEQTLLIISKMIDCQWILFCVDIKQTKPDD